MKKNKARKVDGECQIRAQGQLTILNEGRKVLPVAWRGKVAIELPIQRIIQAEETKMQNLYNRSVSACWRNSQEGNVGVGGRKYLGEE